MEWPWNWDWEWPWNWGIGAWSAVLIGLISGRLHTLFERWRKSKGQRKGEDREGLGEGDTRQRALAYEAQDALGDARDLLVHYLARLDLGYDLVTDPDRFQDGIWTATSHFERLSNSVIEDREVRHHLWNDVVVKSLLGARLLHTARNPHIAFTKISDDPEIHDEAVADGRNDPDARFVDICEREIPEIVDAISANLIDIAETGYSLLGSRQHLVMLSDMKLSTSEREEPRT